ncbi:MAG: FixH family protein, partial [Candidatus Thermoplasmatota archaeon]|nr:FixH family protein [Candidatus Thermoplasmatota archaeon]
HLETYPAHLTLTLAHPTRQGMDRTLTLDHAGDGHYRVALPVLLQTIDIPVSLIADPAELKGRSIEVTFTVQATDDPRIKADVATRFFNR